MADIGQPTGSALEPADPDFERVVRTSFHNQGLMGHLGAWLASVRPGHVVIELPFTDRIGQQAGYFHGGAIGAIADTACGYACYSLMPAGSEVVTVEFKLNFLKPALGRLIRAEGQVLRAGRSVSVARAEVYLVEGERQEACALMQGTFMRIIGR